MRHVAYVFQDSRLLKRSIADNLRVAKPDATEGEMLEALKKAQCTDIIGRLPEGIDTVLGSRGTYLSGGEQQRIAIARALLNEPEVIIADEPTGNLDNETADGIMKLLTKINREQGTAVVMVTHNRGIFEKYPGRVFICRDEKCTERLDNEVIDLALMI